MRLILFIIVFYLIWRVLKSWMSDRITTASGESAGSGKELDDIMVQDPYCEVYFPKQSGYRVNKAGEDLYFCSTECRDKFMANRIEENKT